MSNASVRLRLEIGELEALAVRIVISDCGNARKRARHVCVIRVEPCDPFSASLVKSAVACNGDSAVILVHHADTAVLAGQSPGNLCSRVSRTVVDDYRLPVREILRKKRPHCGF